MNKESPQNQSVDLQDLHQNIRVPVHSTSPNTGNRKYPIDGQVLKALTEASLLWLRTNQQTVNVLNVFPVPDGDTGTNMVLTMQAACNEIARSEERNIGKMAHMIAQGALMGARGNSGVILSQLWRGFARGLDSQEKLDGPSLIRAFAEGRDTAYKGVVRPVEGTILTVAKDIASAAQQIHSETNDPYSILERILPAAYLSVEHTPELLTVLKEAGVVDAGGKGLYYIIEGMVRYINGLSLDTPLATIMPLDAMKVEGTLDSIEPGQDYEVVMDFRPTEPLDLEKFYYYLQSIGTSIQVGEGEGIYRVHIHVPTEKRYFPIDYAMSLGTVTKVTLENLIAQMQDLHRSHPDEKVKLSPISAGQIGVVAVSPGIGISRIFASLGVAAIVEGGQTMNPSTQEILDALNKLPTEQIIILPNNKNIILSAKAAAELTTKSVNVIPSRSIPQGLAAMLCLAPDGDVNEIAKDMNNALFEVQTGEITTATRKAEIDGVKVQEGQIIALLNGKLILALDDLLEACLKLLEIAEAQNYEIITLFYGANLQKSEAEQIYTAIESAYPDLEVELQAGGQPHYHFIISIE